MLPASNRPRLTPQLRRDITLDTLGQISFFTGLYGWLHAHAGGGGLLAQPAVFLPLTATGILNLLHLRRRVRRLRAWQEEMYGK